jgi:hypothetical protein
MIVWGWGRRNVDLGMAETRPCVGCQKEQPFRLLMQYRYFRLYWVFGLVTSKKYLRLCSACGKGQEVEAQQVEPNLERLPIPFMQRYGLLTFAGALVVFIGFMAVFGH